MSLYKSKFTGKQVDDILTSVENKQDKLIAGEGINITGNTISCTVSFNYELWTIVETLPQTGEKNKIYLVPSVQTGGSNIYTEYIYTGSAEQKGWEILGQFQTAISLEGYVSNETFNAYKQEMQTIIDGIEGDVADLQSQVNPLFADSNYEVVLFKKNQETT